MPFLDQIQPFNIKEATQAEYAAMNRHNNRMRRERLPDDPPIPMDEMISSMQNLPDFVDVKMWCAWNPDHTEIIAEGDVTLLNMEENRHITQFDLGVEPEYRCQGLGRKILALITEAARADNRRLMLSETSDRIPAGEAFITRIGGKKGLETHVNQLRIPDLDSSLLERWLNISEDNLAEFEIGFWDGLYPEQQVAAVVELIELTNQQPMGDLEINEVHMTSEQLRQMEKMHFARGNERWTYYVVEKASGRFAGYTETFWNPNRPEILRQDMTGVFPEFRGKGIGRWLKAAMLDKVLKERPQVKYVRTGNADSNAAMLKINNELGFQPYIAQTLWQVEIDNVERYLASNLQMET
ncbi:MAG: GNAT family N-acetyltransferase [Chloroflexi bacterium]|nr:MAG: GNAT family N-acetyltransferase [Chloroflexota bacterium]